MGSAEYGKRVTAESGGTYEACRPKSVHPGSVRRGGGSGTPQEHNAARWPATSTQKLKKM
jgi:hypothetical protein